MKLFIDEEKTFGELVFISMKDWQDYETKVVKGKIVTAGITSTFERINVKIENIGESYKSEDYVKLSAITFDNLTATTWEMNGKSGISYKADNFKLKLKG